MQKLLSAIVLSGMFLIVTSCHSDKSNIKTVITSFFSALNRKDPQSAKLYATKESSDFLNLMQQQIIQADDSTQKRNEQFLISDIKINGNIATASVRSETQQTPLTVTVKKENGEWKVAFDKNSIATMMGIDPRTKSYSNTDSVSEPSPPTATAPGQTLNLADTSVTTATQNSK